MDLDEVSSIRREMNLKIINDDFRNHVIPTGLVITETPYNQGYSYNKYKDKINENDYIDLLSKIPTPCNNSLS